MAEIDEFKELRERGLDRILGLSDGIFAITLMVLDLAVPAIGQRGASAPPSLLAGDSVSFINYFLSFTIIAIWWNAHHRNFEYINDYNGLLKILNLMVLLSITLVPSSRIYSTHGTLPHSLRALGCMPQLMPYSAL